MTDIVQLYRDLYLQLDPGIEIYEKGVSDADINSFEKLKNELPEDLKAIYKQFNGESGNDDESGNVRIFSDYIFINFQSVSTTMESLLNHDLKYPPNEMEKYLCYPERSIKKVAYNPNWIPFATDGSKGYIGVDMDPDEEGKIGQIINFGLREYFHVQIAEDFKSFLVKLKSGYANRKYHTEYFVDSMCIVDEYITNYQKIVRDKHIL